MQRHSLIYFGVTLPLFVTAIFATATPVRAGEGNGCCGEQSCQVLNTPLVPCVTSNHNCGDNPDGFYYFCCEVGPSGCPVGELN